MSMVASRRKLRPIQVVIQKTQRIHLLTPHTNQAPRPILLGILLTRLVTLPTPLTVLLIHRAMPHTLQAMPHTLRAMLRILQAMPPTHPAIQPIRRRIISEQFNVFIVFQSIFILLEKELA